jgi:hypothetical protein
MNRRLVLCLDGVGENGPKASDHAPQREDEWPFPSIWPRKPNAFCARTGPA